jgi:hypothetical protein
VHPPIELVGRPNAYNILAAGRDGARSAVLGDRSRHQASPTFPPLQVVSDPADDVRVIVDYAHLDDAQEPARDGAAMALGRVVTVFGAGDRDRTASG